MAYPAPFHRLVMLGNLYSDTFATSLAIVPLGGSPASAVTQTLCDAVASTIQGWWDDSAIAPPGSGLSLTPAALLTGIKLNRIDTDGRYMDSETVQKIYTTPIPGGGSQSAPAQLSLAATLRCPDERGLAGKGRMFFPPSNFTFQSLGTDGRVTPTNALAYAAGVRQLILKVNAAYSGAGVDAVAGVASATRAGRFQVVTKVSVGRVVDTIRSRRNKILEDPSEIDI